MDPRPEQGVRRGAVLDPKNRCERKRAEHAGEREQPERQLGDELALLDRGRGAHAIASCDGAVSGVRGSDPVSEKKSVLSGLTSSSSRRTAMPARPSATM